MLFLIQLAASMLFDVNLLTYSSFPFWIFTLLSCGAITFVLVLWVVKKPTAPVLDSLMQLFFESAYNLQEDPAEIGITEILQN